MMGAGNPGVSYTRGPKPLNCVSQLGLEPFRTGLQNRQTSTCVHPHSHKQRVTVCMPTPFVQAAGVHAHCLSKWSCVCGKFPSTVPGWPAKPKRLGNFVIYHKAAIPNLSGSRDLQQWWQWWRWQGEGIVSCMQLQP